MTEAEFGFTITIAFEPVPGAELLGPLPLWGTPLCGEYMIVAGGDARRK